MLCFLWLLTLGVLAQSDQLAWPQLHPEWQRDGKHASQAALALLSFEAFQGARPSGTHSRKHSTQVGGTGDHGFVASLGYIARSLLQKTSGVLSGGYTAVPWQIQRKMATMGENPCLQGSPRPQHCPSPISKALRSIKTSHPC